MIEPLYEVLRLVDGDRTPTMGLVYAKLEVAKKRIIVARGVHAYYLHPTFQHEDELAYRDDLLGAVTSVVDRMSRNHEKAATALNEESGGLVMEEVHQHLEKLQLEFYHKLHLLVVVREIIRARLL
ncbi:hypothetical protein Taro_048076 [Colocasia esculenta]|uniref:Uncharacterized protein n=1 Tax=Colocasia esculenta TaxID=4460 RepID=A0A843WXJ2_COLES|nr:hypothetical protein [Colocasia esculenta]